jgi:hypothetical protein
MLYQAFRNTACSTRLTFRQAGQNLVFLPVSETDEPLTSVALGTGKMLSDSRRLARSRSISCDFDTPWRFAMGCR